MGYPIETDEVIDFFIEDTKHYIDHYIAEGKFDRCPFYIICMWTYEYSYYITYNTISCSAHFDAIIRDASNAMDGPTYVYTRSIYTRSDNDEAINRFRMVLEDLIGISLL